MKNRDYWRKRIIEVKKRQLRQDDVLIESLNREYKKALHSLTEDIDRWFERIAKNNSIGLADARKMLSANELEEFHWTVEEYIKYGQANGVSADWKKQLENASAKVHISRLESLEMQVRHELEMLENKQVQGIEKHLNSTYTENYYRTAFEIQKGVGYGVQLNRFSPSQVQRVLDKPWTPDNFTFKDRCWTNKEKLIAELETGIAQTLIRGDSPDQLIKRISKTFNVQMHKAATLVSNESAYFSAEAEKQCYEDLDVEQYEIDATLDSTTCSECGDMDGRVFDMKDYTVGVTAPPFHVRCRCDKVPYFDDNIGTRFARDADSKTTFVPEGMKYKEWKEKILVSKDLKEYNSFVETLGKNAPESIDIFKEIKYNNKKYELFKAYARSLESGELTALADFTLYEHTSDKIDNILIRLTTSKGTQITSKSNHFINRVIGSVEEKRSGVDIEDIKQALTNPEKIDSRVGKTVSSDRYFGERVIVTANPDTGKLIQANPRHRK
ncbi:minor capsid protein [Scatolibacter rhodanostii]|uniref:minor capsid protein n=1 Tax=Scatolibacter rhodanostii TaxID=2014781 RepID=UPI00135668EA|nr:minor capsid protein [Scatolibacter rhodanostii]